MRAGQASGPHVSLVGSGDIDAGEIPTSAQVTDTYLLALARAHGGHLASFDRKLSAAAVKGEKSTLVFSPYGSFD